ncbi:hypothetical protein GCM10027425_15520 [Alteromonas gracilis]
MSEEHTETAGIDDDQLPEDLRPDDDNPLAKPLDPDAEETKDLDELDMRATQDEDDPESEG